VTKEVEAVGFGVGGVGSRSEITAGSNLLGKRCLVLPGRQLLSHNVGIDSM
jgi:hypothetical protein